MGTSPHCPLGLRDPQCRGSRDVGERVAKEVKKRGGGGRQQGGRGEMPRGMRTEIPGSPTSCSADSRAPGAVEGQPQRKGRNVTSGQQPAVIQAITLAAQPGSPLEANSSPHTEGRDALSSRVRLGVCFPGQGFGPVLLLPPGLRLPGVVQNPVLRVARSTRAWQAEPRSPATAPVPACRQGPPQPGGKRQRRRPSAESWSTRGLHAAPV